MHNAVLNLKSLLAIVFQMSGEKIKRILLERSASDGLPLFSSAHQLAEIIAGKTSGKNTSIATILSAVFQGHRPCSAHLKKGILDEIGRAHV